MVLGMNEIKFIDLFGGIGGFRFGLEKANKDNRQSMERTIGNSLQPRRNITNTLRKGNGKDRRERTYFKCVWYCEKDKYAVQTYNKNFKEQWQPTDVTTINPKDIPDFDMLCGGFPCQSFSIAGKRKGFQDIRGTMFFEICRLVKEKKPSILLLENVKGLLSADYGRCFATILLQLDELGYDVEWQVLNSKNFGVPQNRERVFIIGHLRGTGGGQVFPLRQNNKEYMEETTGGNIRTGIQSGENAISRSIGSPCENINRDAVEQESTCNSSFIDLSTQEPKITREARALQSRYWKGYSHRKGETSGIMINNNIRRLTPVECERLQGFPDGWTDGVSDTQRYKQLGNAVTTNVIQAIGNAML